MPGHNGWGEEKPPMTPEEKAQADAELPVKIITKRGQFLIHPDGTKEEIGPEHPLYSHETGI
jgi:hypothetical protein